MTNLPVIGIAATKFVDGANSLDAQVPGLVMLPIDEAFRTEFDTDAHFVTYTVPGEENLVRCNKPILSKVREAGADILSTCLVFDWDNVDHQAWTPELYDLWQDELFGAAENGLPLAASWSAYYSTKHGARLVYVLQEPVPVDLAEKYHRGVVHRFLSKGIKLDPACSDWTRLFRLPRVRRDHEATSQHPQFELVEQWEQRLNHKTIIPIGPDVENVYGEIIERDIEKPDPSWCEQALIGGARKGQSDWVTRAKRRLKNRECYTTLFDYQDLGRPGTRDKTIHRYVGQAVSLLYSVEGATPELVYALFYRSLEQLEPDSDDIHKDWTDVGWNAIKRLWFKEEAKARAEKERKEAEIQDQKELEIEILNNMREWCNEPECLGPDADAVLWMRKRMILILPSGRLHVLRPDGYYDTESCTTLSLVANIRHKGMDRVINLLRVDGEKVIKRRPQDLIDSYGMKVGKIEGRAGAPGSTIRTVAGRTTLEVSLYSLRRDLEPCFDKRVDQWLRTLGGKSYETLCRWISWALEFSGPIAALSIVGPPGCGKKMLVSGLSECITTESLASGKDFGRFNAGLMHSPFLVVDEGLPSAHSGAMSPADYFRRLVSGDPLAVEMKFMDPITVRSSTRVVFTANNYDVIQTLTGNKDLSPDDRRALAVRLIHIEVSDAASRWLEDAGGMRYTRGWVKGDQGEDSDYVLARHFLWLHANRGLEPPGRRFLVDGDCPASLLRKFSTRSGRAPTVIECLVSMIEGTQVIDGLEFHDGLVCVTTSAVVRHHRQAFAQNTREELNTRNVGQVLKGLSVADERGSVAGSRQRWKVLDPLLLYEEALDEGYKHEKLQALAKTRMQLDPEAMLRGVELGLLES